MLDRYHRENAVGPPLHVYRGHKQRNARQHMSIDLSVIIPTFRRPAELVEAIKSVLAQQHVSMEVIVLDDSPEGSASDAVARFTDPRVSYHKSIRPSGGRPALVRNQGWQNAKGRFVHFLDDDDLPAEGSYHAMVSALDANCRAGVVFGRIEPFGNDQLELQRQRAYFNDAAKRAKLSGLLRVRWILMANLLFMNTVLVNSACIVRRECIARLGGYDPDCVINEDVDFYLRAIRRYGYIYLDQVVLHYRTGSPSLMHDVDGTEPFNQAYKHIHGKYRAEHGAVELITLKLLARMALRWI